MTIYLDKHMRRQKSPQAVGDELLQLTNTLRTIALQRPSDPEAQRRARAAIDLYSSVPEFPPLTEPRQPEGDHGQRAIVAVRLPLEIYSVIIGHVAASYDQAAALEGRREETLAALACSCRLFQALTEPYLYTYPRSLILKNLEAQWRFRFALAVEPRRATLVKALKIHWCDDPNNIRILIDTARACPNAHRLKIIRHFVEKYDAEAPKRRIIDLAELLEACPQVTSFNYKTQDYLYPFDYAEFSRDDRFVKFAQRLTEVKIRGPTGWFRKNMLPYLSSNLVSLTLEGEYDDDDVPELFTRLCRQCPSMQILDLRILLTYKSELIEACKKWGPTLRYLRLDYVRDLPGIITKLIPFMSALEDIRVAIHFMHMKDDIQALAQTRLPRLRTFVCVPMARGIGDFFDDLAPAEISTALAGMITLHGPTLQCLVLGDDPRVDETVLKSLKKATNLEFLSLSFSKDIKISVVEDVLDACPKLERQFETYVGKSRRRTLESERALFIGDLEDRLRDRRSFRGNWAPEIREGGSLGW
ncbi:hypothetical protein ACHAPJ_007565 [Fusarium lateritium]